MRAALARKNRYATRTRKKKGEKNNREEGRRGEDTSQKNMGPEGRAVGCRNGSGAVRERTKSIHSAPCAVGV